jgi:hypothetical protein
MKRVIPIFFLSLSILSAAPAAAFASCTRAEFEHRADKIAQKGADIGIKLIEAASKTNTEAMNSSMRHPNNGLYVLLNMAGSLVKLTWRTAPLRPRSFFLDLEVRTLKRSCGKEYDRDYLAARVALELNKRKDEIYLLTGPLTITPNPTDRRVNRASTRKIASRAQPAKNAKASVQAEIRDAR